MYNPMYESPLDDSVDDLMQIRRVLSDMPDIEASYLQDPAQALSSMRQDLVDVLISDINMPEMSGIAVKGRGCSAG